MAHDWYAPTTVKITCKNIGEFFHPQTWPTCEIRK